MHISISIREIHACNAGARRRHGRRNTLFFVSSAFIDTGGGALGWELVTARHGMFFLHMSGCVLEEVIKYLGMMMIGSLDMSEWVSV